MRDLDPSLPGEVMIKLKFLLQFQSLIATVRLASSSSLGGVGTWKRADNPRLHIVEQQIQTVEIDIMWCHYGTSNPGRSSKLYGGSRDFSHTCTTNTIQSL